MRPAAAGYFFSREQWWEHSNFFLDINPDKRDITLNLSDPRGAPGRPRTSSNGPTSSSRTSRRG